MAETAPWETAPAATEQAPWDTPAVPPKRAVATQEAVGRGLVNSATFGLSPAIAGMGEASGNPKGEMLYPNYEGEQGHGVIDTLTGGAKLIHEKLIQPMLGQNPGGLTGQITGDQSGEATKAYHRGRKAALEDERLAQEQHPVAYLTGQLAGALTTPGFGAARGVTTAGRLAHGAGAGAIAGGLYGTGEGISHGEGVGDTALSAAKGVGMGAAFGTAGAGLMEAARPLGTRVINAVRGAFRPEDEASRRVAGAITADFERAGPSFAPEEIAAANTAGVPRTIMDAGGEQTRALARSAANTSPAARAALTDVTQTRFEEQAPRVGQFIQNMTGGANAGADREILEAAARRANKPAYNRAFNDPNAQGMWHEGFEQLMQSPDFQQAARDAVRTGANKAALEGVTPPRNPFVWGENGRFTLAADQEGARALPNLSFWDATKKNLDAQIEAAKRAGDRNRMGDLVGLKRQLVSQLDAAVPAYAQARGTAAMFKGADSASEAGENFARGMNGLQDIRDAEKALARMKPPERELFARAFGQEIAHKVLSARDNVNVINRTFLDSPIAQRKIEMALGPDRARQLEALLRAESIVDRARTNLGNSSTVRQWVEMGLAGGAGAGAEALIEQGFNPLHLGQAVLSGALMARGVRYGAQVVDQRVARRVGEMLASNDPAVLARGVQLAARNPTVFNALREATSGLVRGASDRTQQIVNQPEKPQIRPPGFQRGGRVNAQYIDPTPTEAQKEAGNYAKDHVRVHGLDITIENAKGSKRQGIDKDGKPWSVTMPSHYGYIKGTVGKDKDHVDVYLGHQPKIPRVYVVDQLNAETGKFDEHKCFIGFPSKAVVINTYRKAFSDGRAGERLGHLAEMSIDAFKHWLWNGDTTKPVKQSEQAAA